MLVRFNFLFVEISCGKDHGESIRGWSMPIFICMSYDLLKNTRETEDLIVNIKSLIFTILN